MEYFGWVLAALSIIVLAVVFIYSKGWFKNRVKLPRDVRAKEPVLNSVVTSKAPEREETAESKAPKLAPSIQPDSKVVTVRIVPLVDEQFNAEKLVLGLRAAAFTHGEFDIFCSLNLVIHHILSVQSKTRRPIRRRAKTQRGKKRSPTR